VNPHSFTRVLWAAWTGGGAAWGWVASGRDPAVAVEGRAVLRSCWCSRRFPASGRCLTRRPARGCCKPDRWLNVGGFVFQPAQMQFINPALVMVLIP
jgi:POT family proton-dependent oligopeptide transporter